MIQIELSCGNLYSIGWGNNSRWLAVGSDDGIVKLIKLTDENNISQNLEGHRGKIIQIIWNKHFNKLTTTDENGLIIIWILHKNKWYEEMINNRNKSYVTDFAWNNNGNKIVISYADGAVIVGSVEGSREWSREYSDISIKLIQWSPDSKYLLYITDDNKAILHDNNGNRMCDIILKKGNNNKFYGNIIDMKWSQNSNCLCIAYENGKLQFMKNYNDKKPLLLDADMKIKKIKWNPFGTIIAVVGKKESFNFIQFFDSNANSLSSMQIPEIKNENSNSFGITDCCWELNGLKLALTINNTIYFANIQTNYPHCFFNQSILCYYNENYNAIYCWNTITNKTNKLKIPKLLNVCGIPNSPYALICYKQLNQNNDSQKQTCFVVSMINSIAREINKKYIEFEPKYCDISNQFSVIASDNIVFIWQHSHNKELMNIVGNKLSTASMIEKIFHIDNINTTKFNYNDISSNPITAIHIHCEYLIISRKSCNIICYSLLNQVIQFKFFHSLIFRFSLIYLNIYFSLFSNQFLNLD